MNPHLAMMPKLQRIPKASDTPALNPAQLPEPPMLIPKEEASASPPKLKPPLLIPKVEVCPSPPRQPSPPLIPAVPQKQVVVCVTPAKPSPPKQPIPPKQVSPAKQLAEPPKPADVAENIAPSKSLVGGVTTWFPSSSTIQVNHGDTGGLQINPMRPQFVEYFGMKKFLVIPKHNILSVSPVIAPKNKPKTADSAPVQSDSITIPDTASLGPKPIKSEPSSPVASRTDPSVTECDIELDVKPKDGDTE